MTAKNLSILIFSFCVCVTCAFSQEQKQKVAVYVTGSTDDGMNEFMGAYLVDAIVNGSNYTAVERTADFIRELNKEQAYQQSGAVDDNQISLLGQQFGVDLVCVAKVGKVGPRQFVSARLIDVITATVKSSTKPVLFTLEEMENACAAVAVSLVSGEDVEMKKPKVADSQSQNTKIQNNADTNVSSKFLQSNGKEITFTCEAFPPLVGKNIKGKVEVYLEGEKIWEGGTDGFFIKINDPSPSVHNLRVVVKAFQNGNEIPIVGGRVGGSFNINTSAQAHYELKTNIWNFKVKLKK
ncbi:MAG: hypothetical protein LBH19_15895 [Dysgonamonadaceae bacterium]|jgi:hypothetical protein|nr:hypothetical protein [Dysgonamonadaceae bacterium]